MSRSDLDQSLESASLRVSTNLRKKDGWRETNQLKTHAFLQTNLFTCISLNISFNWRVFRTPRTSTLEAHMSGPSPGTSVEARASLIASLWTIVG